MEESCTLCLSPVHSKGLCSKHYYADYYQKNREKKLAAATKRYEENREELAAKSLARHHADPAKAKAKAKSYRERNRAHVARKNLESYWNNREARLAYTTEYKKMWRRTVSGQASVAAQNTRRRARLSDATGEKVTARDLRELREAQPCCQKCGSTEELTVDHIVPLACRGLHELRNLQTLCGACNYSKQDREISAWRNGARVFGPWRQR